MSIPRQRRRSRDSLGASSPPKPGRDSDFEERGPSPSSPPIYAPLPDDPTSAFLDDLYYTIRRYWPLLIAFSALSALAVLTYVLMNTGTYTNPATTGHLFNPLSTNAQQVPRRIPSAAQQETMRNVYLRSATTMVLRGREAVTLQALQHVPNGQHIRLPQSFYDNVHFGLSGWNPWGIKESDGENQARNARLQAALQEMEPKPIGVYHSEWTWEKHHWKGFVAEFSISHLLQLAGEEANKEQAIAIAREAVLVIARSLSQFVIYEWKAATWGSGDQDDPNRFASVLQTIHPSRTGLRKLRSSGVVYRRHKVQHDFDVP